MKKLCVTGSYTVEAAFLFPLLFICLMILLKTTFSLAMQVQNLAASLTAKLDSASHVDTCLMWLRMTGMLKEVIN